MKNLLRNPFAFFGMGLGLCLAVACTIESSSGDEDDDAGGGTGGSATGDSGPGTGGRDGSDAGSGGSTVMDGGGDAEADASDPDGGDPDATAMDGGDAGPSPGPAYTDTCAVDGDNDTQEAAGAFYSTATVCLNDGDVDWLKITAPDDGKGHIARIDIEQEPGARMQVGALAGADDSQIGSVTLQEGTERTLYITVGSGTTTYLELNPYFGEGVSTLTLTWTAEADPQEPNNERAAAATVTKNTDITGQFIVPYTAADDQTPDDWFAVTLADGAASVKLTDVPENVRFRVVVYDPNGVEVTDRLAVNAGALLTVDFTAEMAGVYQVGLLNYFSQEFDSFTTMGTPKNLVETYTVRIEQ